MSHVAVPRSLAELWDAWEAHPEARLYAGGTDLLVGIRAGHLQAGSLVCLERIPELRGVEDRGDAIWIGGGVPLADLLAHPLIRSQFPVLTRALSELGSPPIRNVATLAGNLCTASPAGDTLPPLWVLGATVEVQSRHAGRTIPVAEFIPGPGRTALGPGELVRAILVPKPIGFTRQHFEKVGQRKALAIAVVSLAALLEVAPSGLVARVRLAWGSVGPGIVTSAAAEAALIGKPLTHETLEAAAVAAREAVSPIADLRAGAAYRRQVAGNLLLRLAPTRRAEPALRGITDRIGH